jgi:hypothetical protein
MFFLYDSRMFEGTHFVAGPEPNMAQGRKHQPMKMVFVLLVTLCAMF